MKKQSVGIGLIGLGVVNGQVARVLQDKADMLAEQVGCPLVLRKIKVLAQDLARPLAREMDQKLFTTSDDEFYSESGIDIIVEAIGGEHPAFEYLQKAIAGGKHVVTSNKEVIAKHGAELLALAQQHKVGLLYEASVGGGIPLLAPVKNSLVGNQITAIHAIINGTTNYILTRMAKEGMDFAVALKQAQELGYAEANPRDDIEGIDATYKLAILASLAFQCQVGLRIIHHEGISKISSRDFRYAKELGFAIKLLAIAKQEGKSVEARVHPVFIPEDTFLAKVDGVYNAIQVQGDLVGKVLFFGEGAGAYPTSSAIISDVVTLAKVVARGISYEDRRIFKQDIVLKPMADIETRYYIRINTTDQPGVLAQISRVLGDRKISISSAIQKESDARSQTAEIVLMTYPARESAMQDALKEISGLPVVKTVSNFIRVEA